jgi:dTDP-glucose pyrophosphorylase
MKALVLAGGRGKRLNAVSQEKNKCMLQFLGKPLIQYSLDNAVEAGVSQIIIVVGYFAEDIINYFGNIYRQVPIRYVIQPEQHGLVHAMECSRHAIGEDDFMLLLGDEILINPYHADMIRRFQHDDAFGICGVVVEKDRSRISRTYTVFYDRADGRIWRLVEKPQKPTSDIMGTGNCVFRNRILEFIEMTPIHYKRGEKELPDLIQCAIDEGEKVNSFIICDRYANVNSEVDLTELEQLVPTKSLDARKNAVPEREP